MKFKKHIPNILSSIRLASPLVLIPLLIVGKYGGAFMALCGFLSTDAIDGYLARKWHVQSDLGAKIDAFADKIILASLLIPLIFSHSYIFINLCLEGAISLVNVYRSLKGGKPKTLQVGREKMIAISLFMAITYLSNVLLIPAFFLPVLFTITTSLQLKTLVSYYNEHLKEQEKKVKSNDREDMNIDSNKMKKEEQVIKDFVDVNNKELDCESSKTEKLQLNKEELIKIRDELVNLKNNSSDDNYSKVKVKQ